MTHDTADLRRARLYRARAIILRRQDLGEADRIVTVYTAEHGKRRMVARGSRRPSSRLAGHLEPFCATRLLVAHTRGLDIISQAEILEGFSSLRGAESAMATAGYIAELVDTLMPEDQAQEAIYDLTFASFRLLSEGRDVRLVMHVFEMGLLRLLGYRPDLSNCVVCSTQIEPVENGFSSEGGVICPLCSRVRPDAVLISVNTLKLLRLIDQGDIERLFLLRVSEPTWTQVRAALSHYISRITGRESPAQRVLASLRLE